jgi:Ca2+-binding EF-hand superfamily protein
MKTLNVTLTSLVLLASTSAMAGQFSDFDSNQDGMISKSEAAASESLLAVFDELDANKDGELSPEEFNK